LRWKISASMRPRSSLFNPQGRQRSRRLQLEHSVAERLTVRKVGLVLVNGTVLIGFKTWMATAVPMACFLLVMAIWWLWLWLHRLEPGNDFFDLSELRALVQEPTGAGLHTDAAVLRVRVI